MSPVIFPATLVASYLLGSLPFSYWVALRRGIDVRRVGSGNVGATNVLRSAGRWAGALALALDAFKGSAAVMLGEWIASRSPSTPQLEWLIGACGVLAVLGHLFPVWLGFRGGKGVATAVGAFALLTPLALAIGVGVFLAVVLVTRYVSLGSIVAAAVVALAAPLTGASRETAIAVIVVVALVIARHHANIRRLLAGTESRLGRARAEAHGGQP